MADTVENLAELFFSKLNSSPNAGVVLAQFYGALTGVQVGRSEIISFSKLSKVFGRTSVFFSIIDVSRKESFTEFPYGLLHTICKNKLEKTLQSDIDITGQHSLERKITDTNKEILKTKKVDPDKVVYKYFEERKN